MSSWEAMAWIARRTCALMVATGSSPSPSSPTDWLCTAQQIPPPPHPKSVPSSTNCSPPPPSRADAVPHAAAAPSASSVRDVLTRARQRLRRVGGRSLVTTREGKILIALALAVGYAAINTGNNLLFFGWGLLLSTIVISGVLSEATLRNVRLSPARPGELRVGQAGPLGISLRNTARRTPSFGLEVSAQAHASRAELGEDRRGVGRGHDRGDQQGHVHGILP